MSAKEIDAGGIKYVRVLDPKTKELETLPLTQLSVKDKFKLNTKLYWVKDEDGKRLREVVIKEYGGSAAEIVKKEKISKSKNPRSYTSAPPIKSLESASDLEDVMNEIDRKKRTDKTKVPAAQIAAASSAKLKVKSNVVVKLAKPTTEELLQRKKDELESMPFDNIVHTTNQNLSRSITSAVGKGNEYETPTDLRAILRELTEMKNTLTVLKTTIEEKNALLLEIQSQNEEMKKLLSSQAERLEMAPEPYPYGEPIMTRRTTDAGMTEFHLGRGIWILEKRYNAAEAKSKREPKLFPKYLAKAVFGSQVLRDSKVFETDSQEKGEDAGRPPLDSAKLLAVQDTYSWWMTTQKKLSKDEVEKWLSDMGKALTRYMCDLRISPDQKAAKRLRSKQQQLKKKENSRKSKVISKKQSSPNQLVNKKRKNGVTLKKSNRILSDSDDPTEKVEISQSPNNNLEDDDTSLTSDADLDQGIVDPLDMGDLSPADDSPNSTRTDDGLREKQFLETEDNEDNSNEKEERDPLAEGGTVLHT